MGKRTVIIKHCDRCGADTPDIRLRPLEVLLNYPGFAESPGEFCSMHSDLCDPCLGIVAALLKDALLAATAKVPSG